ncbi:MAG: DUF4160 domain-containing protein [Proteobacteria bacterium]|nr:DUF4160 domain-containing protein [Pseudomonadota bacterium]
MPTIAILNSNIIIRIYFNDHNPPHIHAQYAEYEASFDLKGKVLKGKLPKRQQNFVSAWIALNTEAIQANIENIKAGIPPIRLS